VTFDDRLALVAVATSLEVALVHLKEGRQGALQQAIKEALLRLNIVLEK
jgi:hypothetical protein